MGDLAVVVAKTAVRRAPEVAVVPEIRDIITNMATAPTPWTPCTLSAY